MNDSQNAVIGFIFIVTVTWLAVAVSLHIIAELKHGRQARRPQNPADIALREQQDRQWDMLCQHTAAVRKKQLAALSNVHA